MPSLRQVCPIVCSAFVEPRIGRWVIQKGFRNKEVADRLFVSPGTLRRHTHSIYAKLAVRDRREAVSEAIELGILNPDISPGRQAAARKRLEIRDLE